MKLLRSLFFLLVGTLCIYSQSQPTLAANKTAIITLSPSTGSITKNQTVTIQVLVNTGGQAVSGVDLSITYSTNLNFTNFSEANSVFNTAVTTPSGNSPLRLARLRFDTGYTGDNGLIGTLTFTGTAAGPATISINDNSEVVAYSDATNIYSSAHAANLTINEPAATNSSAPTTPTADISPTAQTSTPATTSANTTTNNAPTPNTQSSPKTSATTSKTASTPKTTTASTSSVSPTPASVPSNNPSDTPTTTSTPVSTSPDLVTNVTLAPNTSFSPVTFSSPRMTANLKTLVSPANLGALAVALLGLIALPFVVLQLVRTLPKR